MILSIRSDAARNMTSSSSRSFYCELPAADIQEQFYITVGETEEKKSEDTLAGSNL